MITNRIYTFNDINTNLGARHYGLKSMSKASYSESGLMVIVRSLSAGFFFIQVKLILMSVFLSISIAAESNCSIMQWDSLSAYSGNSNLIQTGPIQNSQDSIIRNRISETINAFDQTFLLNDISGYFNPNSESSFTDLFIGNGVIYNFLPGTANYDESISLEAYTENIRETLQTYIIQSGLYHYSITNIKQTGADTIKTANVSYINDIIVYTRQYDRVAAFDLHLNIIIQINKSRDEYKIVRIEEFKPESFVLDFMIVDENNEPVSDIAISFAYYSEHGEQKITRKRHADETGFVRISLLPHDALIAINAPRGHTFPDANKRSTEEWVAYFSTKHLFIEKQPSSFLPSWIRLGSQYHLPVNYFHLLSSGFDFETIGQSRKVSPGTSSYIHFAYNILNKKHYSLYLGSGIEYNLNNIEIDTKEIHQKFHSLTNQQSDTFDLYISSKGVFDSYTHQSVAIPIFFTNRFNLQKSRLKGIDLTTKVAYYFSNTTSFTSRIQQQLIFTEADPGWTNGHNSENTPDTWVTAGETVVRSEIQQPFLLSFDMQVALNVATYKNLWLQPVVAYTMLLFGGSQDHYEPLQDNAHAYQQSLGYQRFMIGNLSAGISLLYNF